ncbi:MAG TPA: ATP-binding protein, partial [Thermoanaerobaculia bacterium]|nr:ATP-binding protein [Thermoanaerobaculia bacterium]
PRFGLSTMRERAESIGGELTIDSTPGSGTTVRFRLPIDETTP